MTSIDLARLDINQLQDLVGNAQTEIASREKQRRKDLRSELERRVAEDGYKMADIGTSFQFRTIGDSPLSAFAVTMPAWRAGSDDEWQEVPAYWPA